MEQLDPRKLEQKANEAAKLLKAMSHPIRLMVLCQLMEGECQVSELNQAIPLSQSALSQHLSGLRRAEIVGTRREGQAIYYHLKSQAVSRILEALYHIYCNPNSRE